MFAKPTLLLAALVILTLPACSTPTSVTTKGALDSFKTISSSKQDTCQTQQEIAEHNSRYDTLKTGKDVTYKAPCVSAKPAKVASADKPKS